MIEARQLVSDNDGHTNSRSDRFLTTGIFRIVLDMTGGPTTRAATSPSLQIEAKVEIDGGCGMGKRAARNEISSSFGVGAHRGQSNATG